MTSDNKESRGLSDGDPRLEDKYAERYRSTLQGLLDSEDLPWPEIVRDPLMVSREEWEAAPPRKTEALGSRVRYVVGTLNTHTPPCFTRADCIRTVKTMQVHHMENLGLDDIKYNFLIGCDGRVYEGRGWHHKSQGVAYPKGLPADRRKLDIAYIGDWRYQNDPPAEILDMGTDLLVYGIRHHYLQRDYCYWALDKRYKEISSEEEEPLDCPTMSDSSDEEFDRRLGDDEDNRYDLDDAEPWDPNDGNLGDILNNQPD